MPVQAEALIAGWLIKGSEQYGWFIKGLGTYKRKAAYTVPLKG